MMNDLNRKCTEGKELRTDNTEDTTKESNTDITAKITWNQGRRVVDLKQLAKDLNNCTSCSYQLNLLDTVKETRDGLGSVLYVKCDVCGTVNTVHTGKKHGESGRGVFDVNSKAAVGKYIVVQNNQTF